MTMRRQGRPARWAEEVEIYRSQAAEAWEEVTQEVRKVANGPGWRVVARRAPGVPLRIVQDVVASRKKESRLREKARILENRESVTVSGADVVHTLDAAHVGWTPEKDKIETHIVRDRFSLKYVAALTGVHISAGEFRQFMAGVWDQMGAPLVLQHDRGSLYMEAGMRRELRHRRILPYVSAPRTPQHNPVAEQGVREIRAYLPMEGAHAVAEAASWVHEGMSLMNDHRSRGSRGSFTARELYDSGRVDFDREECYRDYVRMKRKYRKEAGCSRRARFMADRRAVVDALVQHRLAIVTRGSGPLPTPLPWKS